MWQLLILQQSWQSHYSTKDCHAEAQARQASTSKSHVNPEETL
jgi:hypothetical protein